MKTSRRAGIGTMGHGSGSSLDQERRSPRLGNTTCTEDACQCQDSCCCTVANHVLQCTSLSHGAAESLQSSQSMGDEHASLLLPQEGGLQADPAASTHTPEVCRHKATLALTPAGAGEAAAQKAALGMGGLGRT